MNNEQIPNNNVNPGVVPSPNPVPMNPVDNGGVNPMNVAPSPVAPPSVEGNSNPIPAPVQNIAPEASTPVQPMPNMNLNPVGVVPTPNEVQTPEPSVSPLMSTPLTADTNLNATPVPPAPNGVPAAPQMMPTPGMPGAVPPGVGPTTAMPNMGVPVPPQVPAGDAKEKKPINKTLIIVLVVVLILAVGGGVWFVLFGSKSKTPSVVITPLIDRVELGVQFDKTLASSFATVSGMSPSDCSVDTDIDTTKANTYTFKITCGSVVSGPHNVVVSDTQAPEVTLKDVVVLPNADVKAKDFIDTIKDASIDESKEYVKFVEEVNTTAAGTFDVLLEITDLYNNTISKTGKLIVDENAPEYYYACVVDGEEENQKFDYRFGISPSGSIYNASKKVRFTYENESSYSEAVATYNNTNELNGIQGEAVFNDSKYEVIITVDLKTEDLAKEFDTEFFSEEYDIQDVLGDSCKRED